MSGNRNTQFLLKYSIGNLPFAKVRRNVYEIDSKSLRVHQVHPP